MITTHGIDGHARPVKMALLGAPAEDFKVHFRRLERIGERRSASGALLGCLLLADLHGLTAAIPATVGTGVVRTLGLVAV